MFTRAYGYDGADSLVAIEDAKRGVRRYRYDASNRLVVSECSDRRGRTLTCYGYDAFGRRLWKESAHLPLAGANDDALSPTAAAEPVWQRTDFLWDGDVLLAESKPHRATEPASDALSVVYLHEPGSFRPLAQLRRAEPGQQAQAQAQAQAPIITIWTIWARRRN